MHLILCKTTKFGTFIFPSGLRPPGYTYVPQPQSFIFLGRPASENEASYDQVNNPIHSECDCTNVGILTTIPSQHVKRVANWTQCISIPQQRNLPAIFLSAHLVYLLTQAHQ
jgi:hypothetical protein